MKKRYLRHKNSIIISSRLYSTPSFLIGLGSIFNLAGDYFNFNYSKTGCEADAKAIKKDWIVVGKNLMQSIESVNAN